MLAADAPKGTSRVEASLQPGDYIAFDGSGDNPTKWPHTEFTIAPAAQPAALPAARAPIRAIEFGFRGPTVPHCGELVRFQNDGYLAHMIIAVAARDAASARKLAKLLRAGKSKQAQELAVGLVGFQGPPAPRQLLRHRPPDERHHNLGRGLEREPKTIHLARPAEDILAKVRRGRDTLNTHQSDVRPLVAAPGESGSRLAAACSRTR